MKQPIYSLTNLSITNKLAKYRITGRYILQIIYNIIPRIKLCLVRESDSGTDYIVGQLFSIKTISSQGYFSIFKTDFHYLVWHLYELESFRLNFLCHED